VASSWILFFSYVVADSYPQSLAIATKYGCV